MRPPVLVLSSLFAAFAVATGLAAQEVGQGWPAYGGDVGGSRYSALGTIDRTNVGRLRVAWQIRTGDLAVEPPPPRHMAFQATPILTAGLLLLPTPLGRVIALDPATGEERWRFVHTFEDRRYPEFTSRGVASWRDPDARGGEACGLRIFAATVDSMLFAIDARTGTPCPGFGDDGAVSLREGVGELRSWDYATSSPPVVADGVVILGSAIGDNQRVDAPRGVVRAYDARSGTLRWAWDPIPRRPEDAADPSAPERSWSPAAAKRTGAANAWAPLSVDVARGLVFIPTSSPSPDYYGGERPGDNRHANSVVALRVATGEVVWQTQLVHHDLWDYDVPAQPTLTTVRRDGSEIPAVVQATKMGHLFFLHRETGVPLFPVEERAVPASDVPGEAAWPTQPFPLLPLPIVPQTLDPARDAWGLTPFDRRSCRKRLEALRYEGIFTPPSLGGTLLYPGYSGGTNWGGVAIDPVRRTLVVNATNLPFQVKLIPRERYAREREEMGPGLVREFAPQEGTPYGLVREPVLSAFMLPCVKPPWGVIAGISIDTGEQLWKVPLGTVPDQIPFPIPIAFGLPNLGGPLVTAGGLTFISAAMDGYLRAFDTDTGEEIWKERLPAGGNATPMTYEADGRQYVVIAAGGHGKLGTKRGDYVVAFTLDDRARPKRAGPR